MIGEKRQAALRVEATSLLGMDFRVRSWSVRLLRLLAFYTEQQDGRPDSLITRRGEELLPGAAAQYAPNAQPYHYSTEQR
ncbi:MAG: hypothetical protein C4289_13925 [Chloroflexota bacterium]